MRVPELDTTSDSMKQLRRAAGLLNSVGHTSTTDPGVALLCLSAVANLRRLRVAAPCSAIGPYQVADAISAALASLTSLPQELFATTPVLDAAANARAARALLSSIG